MEAIPYSLRLRLSGDIPQEGQRKVMARIPMFDGPEVVNGLSAPTAGTNAVKGLVFNMECGCNLPETIAFLRECPEARDADIIFGNELDDGMNRSNRADVSAEIARAVGMNYAFALEFIQHDDPTDPKGYGGNTLFSKWPIRWARSLYVPQGFNWYFDPKRRIGERVAIFALLDVGGRDLGAVCVHLENMTSPAARALQMRAILDEAARLFPGVPVLMGGDFNTNTYDGADPTGAAAYLLEQQMGHPMRTVEDYEPLLSMAEEAGFSYRDCNGKDLRTRRKPLPGGMLEMHLDWMFQKGITCLGHGMISTELKDCPWMGADSPLRTFQKDQIADHNALWALCRL